MGQLIDFPELRRPFRKIAYNRKRRILGTLGQLPPMADKIQLAQILTDVARLWGLQIIVRNDQEIDGDLEKGG